MSSAAIAGSQPIQVGVGKSQVISVALLVTVAIGAFVLSFQALTDLGVRVGITASIAALLPIIIDGVILASTISTFVMSTNGSKGEVRYSWFVLILFSAISIWGNSLHAYSSTTRELDIVTASVISAIPPVSLLLTTHLLAMMVNNKNGKRRSIKAVNKDGEAIIGSKGKTDTQIISLIKRQIAKGKTVTSQDLVRWTGASAQSAGSKLGRLRRDHPEIFGLAHSSQNALTE